MSNPALSNARAHDAKLVLLFLTLAKYRDLGFTCTSAKVIYCITCTLCNELYIQMKNDPRSYWSQFLQLRKEAWKKFRTSTGLEPVTSRYRCDALPTELWSHWRWEQVNFGFICSRERYEGEWCIWNKSYVNCGYEIKWRMILAVTDRNFCNCVKKLYRRELYKELYIGETRRRLSERRIPRTPSRCWEERQGCI